MDSELLYGITTRMIGGLVPHATLYISIGKDQLCDASLQPIPFSHRGRFGTYQGIMDITPYSFIDSRYKENDRTIFVFNDSTQATDLIFKLLKNHSDETLEALEKAINESTFPVFLPISKINDNTPSYDLVKSQEHQDMGSLHTLH